MGVLGCCWYFGYAPNVSPVLAAGEEDAVEDNGGDLLQHLLHFR